jgi:hypothetical protein
MSQVEVEYDQFLSSIAQQITNTDVDLLVKVMYLERKLPDVAPKVDLHMEFKPNVDPMKKQDQYRAKFGFPTQTSEHGLTVTGQMNIDLIERISKDPDVEHMSGKATPASY